MSGPPAIVVLALVALLVCACDAGPALVAAERSAPPARGGRVDALRSSVASTSARGAGASAADAIARLRSRLVSRGFAPEVTAGPMLAIWSENPPRARLAGESAIPAAARDAIASPTWLVLTDAGAWWVWEHDDLGPVAYAPSSRF